jgi:hypothetical protein
LSRRDYQAIAKVIREFPWHDDHERAAFISHMRVMLKADNPRFDKDRFVDACWPTEALHGQ